MSTVSVVSRMISQPSSSIHVPRKPSCRIVNVNVKIGWCFQLISLRNMASRGSITTLAKRCKVSYIAPRTTIRAYSAHASLINTEIFPARHCGHIKVLRLNRPDAKNAISRQLLADLGSELSALDCGPQATRVLIIASDVPRVFCAGADLKERRGFSLNEYAEPFFVW